jgi:hypothetical protein
MTKTVFIVSNGGHDYSDASRYGELRFCTERVIRKDDVSQMYRELNAAMLDAKPDDFLLVSSLTSLCSVAASILAARFGEVHFLIFRDGQYVQRDLILDDQDESSTPN